MKKPIFNENLEQKTKNVSHCISNPRFSRINTESKGLPIFQTNYQIIEILGVRAVLGKKLNRLD